MDHPPWAKSKTSHLPSPESCDRVSNDQTRTPTVRVRSPGINSPRLFSS